MKWFSTLPPHTTILTPNQRLAATLAQQYNALQLHDKKNSWATVDILPITSWFMRLWRDFTAQYPAQRPYILTAHQALILWETIVEQSPHSKHLLQISGSAELAKTAWSTLKQWLLPLDQAELSLTEDAAVFQTWAKQFQTICSQHHWQDTDTLPQLLIEQIHQGTIQPAKNIVLYGFTELTPQQKSLLQAATMTGSVLSEQHNEKPGNTVQKISLPDQETEILTIARWAKSLYEKNNHSKIGCVFPHLEMLRDTIVKIFSEVFSEKNTFTTHAIALPFNLSIGKPFTHFPMIHGALQLLQLNTTCALDVFSYLLRSPFMANAEYERISRAKFDSYLRKNNRQTITVDDHFLQKLAAFCPALAKSLTSFLSTLKNTSTQSMHAWIELFNTQLNILGWPGERSLNSPEYQIAIRWQELLLELNTLAITLPKITRKKALQYLMILANKLIYQPQSPETPIQILGILEAAELSFDYLWVMGLDDRTWPPAPKLNPFIPAHIQKKYAMPHASAERELQYCQHIMQQLSRSALHVIFSHASHDTKSELRPSALLAMLEKTTLDHIALVDHIAPTLQVYQSAVLETYPDTQAPMLDVHEQITGGVNIFKLQAACPFKAFAEIRLHARQIDDVALGLRAKDRGKLVHKALELLWKALTGQQALINLTAEHIAHLIHQSATEALHTIMLQHHQQQDKYFTLELKRLKKLLHEWLVLEKDREPFTVIAHEQEQSITIGPLPITVRVDRIDELANGKLFILDYKTGYQNSRLSFFGERPDEPQLPIYCLTHAIHNGGIAFAQIHPGKMDIIGISQTPFGSHSVKTLSELKDYSEKSWQQQLADWKIVLEKLAHDFYQGDARVDPKHAQETCRYCHLQPLCRIHEMSDSKHDET